nr:unnamed protein product [Callosobruchus analis]
MYLALNTTDKGKGSEFKGKSLDEIEVSEDVIEAETHDPTDEGDANPSEVAELQHDEEHAPQNTEKSNGSYTSIESTSEAVLAKPIRCRERWSPKGKKLVVDYFKDHIEKKIVPKKLECLEFIKANRKRFNPKDWVRIKTLVYNTYRLK